MVSFRPSALAAGTLALLASAAPGVEGRERKGERGEQRLGLQASLDLAAPQPRVHPPISLSHTHTHTHTHTH
jgi:hypothetical protein